MWASVASLSETNLFQRTVILVCSLVNVTACTTVQINPSYAVCLPTSLDVLTLPPDMNDVSLRRVFHDVDKTIAPDELQNDRQRIGEYLQSAVEQTFVGLGRAPITVTHLQAPAVTSSVMDTPLSSEDLSALQTSYPAENYLRLRITDFGETPRRWKNSYIAFEVVTTLAIAGAFYVHRITKPLAGAYLIEESVEEISEGYAGFWALNRLSQPVRIESDLIDGHTGKILLHMHHTGLAHWKWHNVWHMNATIRNDLELLSMQQALSAVMNDVVSFYLKSCPQSSIRFTTVT